MKEKSAMDDKIFDFDKTRNALSQMSTDLLELETTIRIKSSEVESRKMDAIDNIKEKEQKIAELTKATQDALEKIDSINNYISEVL
ncbi:MAG: hypothetical protein E7020_04265 [Alphaproteobacteria bacterium]|nr:hypothetical protein [Alphaproteobacteria bacterium]